MRGSVLVTFLAIALVPGCEKAPDLEDPDDHPDGGNAPDAAPEDAGGDPDAGAPFDPPDWCPAPEEGLQDVTGTPARTYFVRHPDGGVVEAPVVVFLPGGYGDHELASITFDRWLSQGDGIGDFRVVMPYAEDGDFTDEGRRTLDVLDEVATCFGEPSRVHLGGTSLGGLAAFSLALEAPDRFSTLLGAPGMWDPVDEDAIATAMVGKAVFNGVGELDAIWQDPVRETHALLERHGVDSTFVEFAGRGHLLEPDFDTSVFFDFWSSH